MKAALAALVMLSACSSETALLLEVDSTLAVPGEVNQLEIVAVGTRSGGMLSQRSTLEGPFPQSFAIRPKDDDSEEVTITVSARLRSGATSPVGELVTDSVVVTAFVPGQVRNVRVLLDSACGGVRCAASETCIAGACVPLVSDAGVDSAMDATTDSRIDAGPVDSFPCAAALSCNPTSELCCHTRNDGAGSCIAPGATCAGQPVECADAADCGGGDNVCCARFATSTGNLQDVRCRPSAAECTGPTSQQFEVLCGTATTPAAACPAGLACTGTSSYAALAWRACE